MAIITGPGEYRTRGGIKAVITHVNLERDPDQIGWAVGYFADQGPRVWHWNTRGDFYVGEQDVDRREIVGRWEQPLYLAWLSPSGFIALRKAGDDHPGEGWRRTPWMDQQEPFPQPVIEMHPDLEPLEEEEYF